MMVKHRLLLKAIVVLALAVVANVTSSDHLTAEAPTSHCAVCFLQEDTCEGNEDGGCYQLCNHTQAISECLEYDPDEVECFTHETVYDFVVCDDIS